MVASSCKAYGVFINVVVPFDRHGPSLLIELCIIMYLLRLEIQIFEYEHSYTQLKAVATREVVYMITGGMWKDKEKEE